MGLDIRGKQKDALVRMLHFNAKSSGHHSTRAEDEAYKVLILDASTKDIVAPLLRVDELRSHGVTLHMQINADRQVIPDVSAIYFVEATEENVLRIAEDAKKGLYDSLYLNFSSKITRKLLQKFAGLVVNGNAAARISQVYDQHVNFVSLEPRLFSLGLKNTYLELNDPCSKDNAIEKVIEQVVEGIYCTLVTSSVVPIICSPPGGAAEHVARMLDSKIRGALQNRTNLFNEGLGLGLSASLQRPLLCLFDRNFELSVSVQHAWMYKPLVHDALGLHLNRTESSPYLNGKVYQVDSDDYFWENYGNEQFPRIAEEVENELKKYKQSVEDLNKATGANIDPNVAIHQSDMVDYSTKGLKSALMTLPQLTERKRNIDKHTNLATALLQVIKERKLDHFYSLEEDLVSGKSNSVDVIDRLSGPEGTPADKMRLALVWLLTSAKVPSDSECKTIENVLQECGADMAAWFYVKRMRKMNLTGKGQHSSSDLIGSGTSQFAADFLGSTFGQGLSSLTKGVKNLLAGEQQAAVTVAVESLMDGKQTSDTDGYIVLDPKSVSGSIQSPHQSFKEAIVFVIGGGNYLEWVSLASWASRTQPSPKSVAYGASDLISGEQMISQLAELGRRSAHV
eukprot:jgi/Picsp_1/4540/NSC_06761-R1_sm sec1-family protein